MFNVGVMNSQIQQPITVKLNSKKIGKVYNQDIMF
jgi:hypothetical protein